MILIGGIAAEASNEGFMFGVEGGETYPVNIAGATQINANGTSFYKLSDSNTLNFEVYGTSEEICNKAADEAQSFLGYVIENGFLVVS